MGLTRPRAYQIYDIDYKQAVRVITLTNISLSGGAPAEVDGVTLSTGDRVLVAGQSTGSLNGLYEVDVVGTGSNGTWIRTIDGNQTGEIQAGMIVMVTEGTSYADTQWKLITNDPITIGVTALEFEQSSAYSFGTITANATAIVADTVGDTVTFTPGNNFIITGNAATDTITFEVSQSPIFTGNVTGGNLTTGAQVVATGNITGGNLVTAGHANVGTLSVNGGSNFTGNLLPSANVTYNLGSPTQRWNEIFLAGSTIDIGGATISADLNTGSLILTGPDGAEFILTGNDADDALGAFGFVSVGNTESATSTTTGALTVAGGAGIAGNIYSGGLINATGNITGGNLVTSGQLSAVGNISGNYILGNITFASGYNTTKLFNGTSEANIGTSGGNANISIGGVSNVAVFASTGEYVTGVISATGNITGGNIVTAGQVNATGNITGGNLSAGTGVISTTGNVNGANINATAGITAGTTIISTGNVSGGNITTIGQITATGNVTGGNLSTGGLLLATGNITGGNIVTAGQVNATGNITGSYFLGNGSQLTGINSFSTIAVADQSSIVADSISDTLTLAAGDGIVITTVPGTDTITIATAGGGDSIFATGGDMGTVDEAVTAEEDLGSVTVVADTSYDLGTIVNSGIFYPDQLVIPSYTVAQLANLSATPAGQMVYCSNESGGAVPAFSDGSDWRRVTDRAVVS